MVNAVSHSVVGSKENGYHNFSITIDANGQTLIVSSGSYWYNNVEVFNISSPVMFNIPAFPTVSSEFQTIFETCVFLTKSGIVMKQAMEEIPDLIDRLVWFSLTPDFQSIQVEYTQMVEG